MAKFARIIVDHSLDREFDYAVPEGMDVVVGSRVRVPFRNRILLGTVIALPGSTAVEPVKPLAGVVGGKPLIPPKLVEIAHWMADYYCCPLEVAMRCVLPQVIRKAEVGFAMKRFVAPVRPVLADEMVAIRRRSPKQADILEALAASATPLMVSTLAKSCSAGAPVIKALEKKGLVRVTSRAVARDPHANEEFVPTRPLPLSAEQSAALEMVLQAVANPRAAKPVLLFGVTGSGKTEVYLQAIDSVVKRGLSAIVLVPEISLTPQTVERFKARFAGSGTAVAVLHSHLSDGERHDEWHQIHSGAARIVVGARSAVFAPVLRPGLIVVDEEHEHSYKQEEAPRYHARDVAVVRSSMEPCAILLGSATPSLESYHNARCGKYAMTCLGTRADDRTMPVIRVVDMRIQPVRKGPVLLSSLLCNAIEERLARSEQTILFLNRRGYSTSLTCPACGHVCRCKHCSIAMTYHRSSQRLVCHMCGHTGIVPKTCPECHDPKIRHGGPGTERIEDQVAKIFPSARIARMDADTMTRKEAYRETLGAFRKGAVDILIGTQMIAKGLHFPNVTLVGIVNADLTLHLPDFRAGERTFQLLTQVAGRAGRGEVVGEVFVQTFTPHSPSIQYARKADFVEYAAQELEFRKFGNYPPFTRMVLLTVRCPHAELCELTARTLERRIREGLPAGSILGEPAPAPIERLKGDFRFHIAIRSASIVSLSRHVRAVLKRLTVPEEVDVTVDVDPFSLL